MAELAPGEMLLPSLLDRLVDDAPNDVQESRNKRVETIATLRKAVLRDLEALMNTSNLENTVDFSEYPEVATSVVNYGLPNMSGSTISSVDLPAIERFIAQAIKAYEPRILPNTVRVKYISDAEVSYGNSVVFQIEGTLWGKPMPEVLFLRTELDLELGEVVLKEGDA